MQQKETGISQISFKAEKQKCNFSDKIVKHKSRKNVLPHILILKQKNIEANVKLFLSELSSLKSLKTFKS